ncbi:Ig-like domain containing protein [Enterococcus phage phiSHEF13]|uniref:Ig-like domain containing protein n=1 Tax=Enterococcus phage phiSHEF13 TaxID=2918648 RepID=A0AAE9FFN8_9CAUD|nr:Ig-like domain containing protein [Enterococcus phage phiSHEF13]
MSNFFRNIHPLLRRSKRPEKYDDTNFAVLNALNYELTQAEQETIASKIQSSLESATDTYLDTWGDWFGVYRKDGWDDEYYRARIIRELLLKRGTVPAIIDALLDFLNDNDAVIQIYEPWRNIFYTNKSKLNGDDHLMGYYYRFAIIDISIDRPFPPEIVEIIKAFKPAGVLFYLRLDTSLNKNKTTVESPYVYLDVTNKTELEFLNGLYYDLRGNISLSDQRTQVVENNIFHTNNSMLNGEDVLAGAFDHGRGYIHLASTSLTNYTPKATDSMSDVKNTLGEAGADFYSQTKELDGRTAQINVPSTKNIHTMYSNTNDFRKPNLLPIYNFSNTANFIRNDSIFSDGGTYLIATKNGVGKQASIAFGVTDTTYITPLLAPSTQYKLTLRLRAGTNYKGVQGVAIPVRYRYTNADGKGSSLPISGSVDSMNLTKDWQEFSFTGTTLPSIVTGTNPYIHVLVPSEVEGSVEVGYDIKLVSLPEYDYSGNPNVAIVDKNLFANGSGAVTTYSNGVYSFELTGTERVVKYNTAPVTSATVLDGQRYTLSAEIYLSTDYVGSKDQLVLQYSFVTGGYTMLQTGRLSPDAPLGQWLPIKGTSVVNYAGQSPNMFYFAFQHLNLTDFPKGTVKLRNLKIERGDTVTPYQPNLLDAPYQLSKIPLNKNIANPSIKYPINTSAYLVYGSRNTEPYKANQKYTLTLKGTKQTTQSFNVFLNSGTIGVGAMSRVEGQANVWQKTFTVSQAHIDNGVLDMLTVYQVPNSTAGSTTIEWLKLEEGDVATSPIDNYKYMGVRIENTDSPTTDPTKYDWKLNEPITGRSAYMAFDIKTFIDENYRVEFDKLVEELGEDEAYNTLFENFKVSTALKALVSPSNPLNCIIELFDFSTNAWHVLSSTTLDLRTKVLNLEANRVTDYLNDYRLLFVRYSFTNVTSKDVTVELDMLNILFNYRLGDGYSVGLQSKVETLTDIPASDVSLSKDTLVLGIGESEAVTATLLPVNVTNTNLEWLILDPNIAKVTSSGNITGLSEGETKLIVYGDDRNVSAECDVKVVIRPTAIALDKETININI